ncbi:uncharacterized protein LOC129217632 [Uloborus diversus]|uniref:uncharacterized protein LOC129217632 n=1 Tax=Uloborus diversus TaxID=327109 RepID=UPI00240A858C|nr:uncharacterized protein LOC129217632 [Uloborus diversus]
MNTLVIFALCCITFAICQDEEEFPEKWKNFMQKNFCNGDDAGKETVVNCASMLPEEMQQFMIEKTKAEDVSGALQAFCDDADLEKEACEEFKEKGTEISEEDAEKIKTCMMESS